MTTQTLADCCETLRQVREQLNRIEALLLAQIDFETASRNDYRTVETIKHMVADHFSIPLAALSQKSRGRNGVCFPRQIAMTLTLEFTHLTQVAVGQAFGGRDHATTAYAADAVERRMGEDKVSKAVQKLREQIKEKLNGKTNASAA